MDEQIKKRNQLRMLKTCHRQIHNLLTLGRIKEAAIVSGKFTGILKAWSKRPAGNRKCKFD